MTLLVAHGGDVKAKDKEGATPLHDLVRGSVNFVSPVWPLDVKSRDSGEDEEESEEVRLAFEGLITRTITFLLEHGAEVDALDSRKMTPLQCAYYPIAMRLLVSKGASPNVRYWQSWNVSETLLQKVLREGDMAFAEELIARGADVNVRGEGGNTLLHSVVRKGDKKLTELLLGAGADVNAKNPGGTRPLHYAVSEGHKEIATLLLEKGADVNARDNDGDTALHAAALRGRTDLVELLLQKGADRTLKDNGRRTPADEAGRRGYRQIVELLRRGETRK
jgi:ankyrin repeat protein